MESEYSYTNGIQDKLGGAVKKSRKFHLLNWLAAASVLIVGLYVEYLYAAPEPGAKEIKLFVQYDKKYYPKCVEYILVKVDGVTYKFNPPDYLCAAMKT